MAGKTLETEAPAEEAEGGKKKKKKRIVVIVPVLVIALAAGWFLFLRGGGEQAPAAAEPEHQPGVVLVMEPITINLAGGHFLKVGLALQQDAAKAGGHGEPDGSKALDLAIGIFSGLSIDELSTAEGRESAKAELLAEIEEAYHHEFYDIYFTEFIMQ
jgi:flagellar FliL protein